MSEDVLPKDTVWQIMDAINMSRVHIFRWSSEWRATVEVRLTPYTGKEYTGAGKTPFEAVQQAILLHRPHLDPSSPAYINND